MSGPPCVGLAYRLLSRGRDRVRLLPLHRSARGRPESGPLRAALRAVKTRSTRSGEVARGKRRKELARVTRVPVRTISPVLRRAGVAYPWQCDPLATLFPHPPRGQAGPSLARPALDSVRPARLGHLMSHQNSRAATSRGEPLALTGSGWVCWDTTADDRVGGPAMELPYLAHQSPEDDRGGPGNLRHVWVAMLHDARDEGRHVVWSLSLTSLAGTPLALDIILVPLEDDPPLADTLTPLTAHARDRPGGDRFEGLLKRPAR